ncbi:MAG TPA: hypothetical protein VGB18_09390 [Candidatus Thermoplasmatota archaeon]
MRRIVLVAVFFVYAVGSASGQAPVVDPEVTVTATSPEGLLEPETGRVSSTLTIRMTCPVPPALAPFHVRFAVKDAPPYATVILNPPSLSLSLGPNECGEPGFEQQATVDAIMTTNRNAPAYVAFTVAIEASVSNSDPATNENREYGPFEAQFNVTNEYVPFSIMNPAQLYVKAGQGANVDFPLEIQNLGNGNTLYQLTAEKTNGSSFQELRVPPEFVLESRAANGQAAAFKRTVSIEVRTNEGDLYENRIEQFNLNVVSRSSERNDSATDTHTIAFAVQVQGASNPTPFPLFGPVVVAMFVGLLWARKTRGRRSLG